jgi:hypothetical protein
VPNQFILSQSISRRARWIDEIVQISGRFGDDTSRIEIELQQEVSADGSQALLDHLRMAGCIPECYDHDSSEEKLYSKYTDVLLAATFRYLGLNSVVLSERGDSADVEAASPEYSFVADAKAFRMSRTAKNQKDFKVEAMHVWKRGKPFAIIVCPIYQLPRNSSQIYQQAISRTVCIFTYSHLSILVKLAQAKSAAVALDVLNQVLRATDPLNPSKDAMAYWFQINKVMLQSDVCVPELWKDEKIANLESIAAAKEEALTALAQERSRILQMTHQQAINALVRDKNIDGRIQVISAVADNEIMTIS